MKKKEEKEKQEKKKESRYLAKPLTTLPCKYLEVNGIKKCTHKANEDVRKKQHLDGREDKGLVDKRCECRFCPLFDKKEYCRMFKK